MCVVWGKGWEKFLNSSQLSNFIPEVLFPLGSDIFNLNFLAAEQFYNLLKKNILKNYKD